MAAVRWTTIAVLAAVVIATHAGSLGGTFHFDDHHSLVHNPHVRSLTSIPAFFTDPSLFSRNPGSAMYRPVVLTSYAVNHAVGGLDPRGYHIVNLILHLATSAAVFAVLRGIAPGGLALGAALLFAVHPLTTQPVHYVSARSEILAALFVWLSLWLYAGPGRWRRGGSLLAYALALGSKAVAVWLAPALVIHAWATRERHAWRRQWPYWGLTAGYLLVVRGLLHEAFVESPVRGLATQLWTQAKALVYYLRLITVSHPLTVEHDFVAATAISPVVLVVLLLLASLGLCVWRGRRQRLPVMLAGWALLALAPTALTPLNVLVSEHRTYAALPSLAMLLVLLMAQLRHRRLLLALGVAAMVLIDWQRGAVWASEVDLWRDAAAKTSYAPRPHVQLGALYRRVGALDSAAAQLHAALRLDPNNAAAHSNLGNVRLAQGDLAAAEASYQRALQLLPSYPEALTNLGVLRGRQGRWTEALALHEAALAVSPGRAEVLVNAAVALLELERYPRAEQLLRHVLAQGETSASVHYNLGGALEGQGEVAAARAAYEAAVECDPSYAKPYLRLASLHEAAGRSVDARQAYEAFLRTWRGDPAVAAAVRRKLQGGEGGGR